MEEFSCKTRIVAGAGAVSVLENFGAKRLFLVTDPLLSENGTARKILRLAKAENFEIFDRVHPRPTVALAAEGSAKLNRFRPDLLVALGSGSTIDCAKAMAYFSRSEVPLAAIPTTSGSGAEVTDFAILTHGQKRHPLSDPRLQPDLAILDSDLLAVLPRACIADDGFDLLTHAVESYAAKDAGTISGMWAAQAFRTAFAALPASFAGQEEVRLKVHLASAMAGLASAHAGLGLCHAIAHSLGALFPVSHGRLNAILLPAVIDCNARGAAKRYGALARAAGMGGSTDDAGIRNLLNGILRLRRELELPQTLMQAGITPGMLWANMPRIVETVLEDPCCESNPLKAEAFLIRRILENTAGHWH